MRIAILSRYPRVDTAEWKLALLEQLCSGGHALTIHYTRSALADQMLDGVREFGLSTLARYRQARRAPQAGAPTSVAGWAAEHGLPVHRHRRIGDAALLASVRAAAPDVMILAGADIVGAQLLAVPRIGTINPHYGMLPRYRGMNVAEWSVYHDDPVGVTVHLVDPGIDTGAIVEQAAVDIGPGETLATIRAKQQRLAAELLLRAVERFASGEVSARPQEATAGRQFYRMHPRLRAQVERKLAAGAYRPDV
jgi:methionyl-tRNA formyltransferase